MPKELKKWNGRGHGKYEGKHMNIAAYSQKQAAELLSTACNAHISVNEIRVYYSQCWGNSMNDFNPQKPCIYVEELYGKSKPVQVL